MRERLLSRSHAVIHSRVAPIGAVPGLVAVRVEGRRMRWQTRRIVARDSMATIGCCHGHLGLRWHLNVLINCPRLQVWRRHSRHCLCSGHLHRTQHAWRRRRWREAMPRDKRLALRVELCTQTVFAAHEGLLRWPLYILLLTARIGRSRCRLREWIRWRPLTRRWA